jgi:hypothetical protein
MTAGHSIDLARCRSSGGLEMSHAAQVLLDAGGKDKLRRMPNKPRHLTRPQLANATFR